MEFSYVLGMSLACSNEVFIFTLNNNTSHRLNFYVFFWGGAVLTDLGLSHTDDLNYEINP